MKPLLPLTALAVLLSGTATFAAPLDQESLAPAWASASQAEKEAWIAAFKFKSADADKAGVIACLDKHAGKPLFATNALSGARASPRCPSEGVRSDGAAFGLFLCARFRHDWIAAWCRARGCGGYGLLTTEDRFRYPANALRLKGGHDETCSSDRYRALRFTNGFGTKA
jgi:hypothetical protein